MTTDSLQKPELGSMAPLFSLQDQNGEVVNLKDFRGKKKVLIYFYPKAMTPGCTTQACGLRDAKSSYDEQEIAILGISPDTPARLKKFEQQQGLNFSLLSDPEHQVAEAYGVWGPKKFMGRVFDGIHRVSFIVGKDGKLKQILDKVKTKSHHQDALDWMQANL